MMSKEVSSEAKSTCRFKKVSGGFCGHVGTSLHCPMTVSVGRGSQRGDVCDICQFVANKLLVDETHYTPCMFVRGECQRKLIYSAIHVVKTENGLLIPGELAKQVLPKGSDSAY
jgi:hypothetical protein